MHPRLLQENIVEKILRDREGRLARVSFHIYESNGRIRARVVNVHYIEEVHPQEILALEGTTNSSDVIPEQTISFNSVASPFVDSQFIYTTGSKPRAPAFR